MIHMYIIWDFKFSGQDFAIKSLAEISKEYVCIESKVFLLILILDHSTPIF